MKIFKTLAILLAVAVAALVGVVIWQWDAIAYIIKNAAAFTEGAEEAKRLKTPDDVLDYIAAHRESASLVAYRVGDVENGVYLHPDAKRALASTMKILLLVEFARQADAELLSPDEPVDIAQVDAYYLPNTDGGAHEAALQRMREKGILDKKGMTALRHVVGAMMTESDNAATDYVLMRLGRENVEALPSRLELPDEDAPLPPSGMFLSWLDYREDAPPPFDAAYADRAYALAARMRDDAAFRKTRVDKFRKNPYRVLPGFAQQRELSHALVPRGTARGYAAIMERIYAGTLFSESASALMREILEWPMAHGKIKELFDDFGTKGGSLPGVLTSAIYAKAKGGEHGMVAALYLENLPFAVWMGFMESRVQQEFERKILTDAEFFEKVKTRLADAALPSPEGGAAKPSL